MQPQPLTASLQPLTASLQPLTANLQLHAANLQPHARQGPRWCAEMAADIPQLHKELAFTRGALERAGRQAERSEVPPPKVE